MPKALCIAGIVIAALLLMVFGLDLVIPGDPGGLPPFNKANIIMDIGFVLASGILGFLSYITLREQL